MAAPIPKPKKRKLDHPKQIHIDKIIAKLDAIDLTCSSMPLVAVSELISPLKPGIGLLGNAQEEEGYYAWYLQNEADAVNEQVTVLLLH